jgi:hypothetical protein
MGALEIVPKIVRNSSSWAHNISLDIGFRSRVWI